MQKDSRIYIAGHKGLVGSAIYSRFKAEGFTNLITRTRSELDLERQRDVEYFFMSEQPEYVLLAAAKVGGIWANANYPAEFIYRNLTIQTNLIHASWKVAVRRLLFLGSSCIYPRECPQPMREEHLLTGPLESTNQPYALAKIAGISQCEAYNRQYGTRFLAVMPTNLYGPNDNFDLETGHVLPTLIRKFHLAKLASQGDWEVIQNDEERYGPISEDFRKSLIAISKHHGHNPSLPNTCFVLPAPAVPLWGTGSPRREFLHADDLTDACLFLISLGEKEFDALCSGKIPMSESAASRQRFDQPKALSPGSSNALPLINIGCGADLTIRELVQLVSSLVGYQGEVTWDDTKPNGTPRKLLDISRLKALGWFPGIGIEEGLKLTYHWYRTKLHNKME